MAYLNIRQDLLQFWYQINVVVTDLIRFQGSNEIVYDNFNASDLFSPTRAERSFFVLSVAVLFVLSMCGNILTVFVNLRRKMRLFFRVCLISLACSDLLITFFLSITYMSQFRAEYVQYWSFSETMCHVVPFITTSAIMVSSISLLGIAADRYYAVRAIAVSIWNPTSSFCLLCFLLIWTASITISSPIYFIYELVNFYIIDDTSEANVTEQPELVLMCIFNEEKIGSFYMVIVFIIFMPCIVAFFWLNTIIAITIWHRRRPMKSNVISKTSYTVFTTKRNDVKLLSVNCKNGMVTTSNLEAQQPSTHTTINCQSVRSPRELRHIKLFTIMILMMLVFLVCRLPAWILLMLRMYGIRMTETTWRLYFYFGLMHLSSCMLNPLFYTFLSGTTEYARVVRLKIFNTACRPSLHCKSAHNIPPMASTIYGGVDDDLIPLPSEREGRCQFCCRRTTITLASTQKPTTHQKQQAFEQNSNWSESLGENNIRCENFESTMQEHKDQQSVYTIQKS